MLIDSATATGALVQREMLTAMRQGKTWALMTLAVLLTFGTTAFALATMGEGGLNAIEAQQLFGMFSLLLFGAAVLLVPLYASTLVCQEKQENTYDSLLTSLIPPWGIVSGKILSALAFFLFIVVATMPLLGVFFFFAGVDQTQFNQAFLIITCSALASGAIGVACSAVFYRSAAAILLTVLGVASFHGALMIGLLIGTDAFWTIANLFFVDFDITQSSDAAASGLLDQTIEIHQAIGDALPVWCPPAMLFETVDGTLNQRHFPFGILYQAAAIIAAWFVALRFLRRPAKPMKVRQDHPIDDQEQLRDRRKKFPYYLVDPLRRSAAIPDERNPMYYKELLSGFLGDKDTRIRLFYVYLVIGLIAIAAPFAVTFDEPSLGIAMGMLLQTAAILLAVPVIVASVFTKEFESGGLDMLRMTMLRTVSVVSGKLFAVAITIAPMLLAMFLIAIPAAVIAFTGRATPLVVLCGLVSMLVTVAYATGISAVATLFTRRMGAAIIASYIACVAFIGGLPFFGLFIFARLNILDDAGIFAGIVSVLSPATVSLYYAATTKYAGAGFMPFILLVSCLLIYARLAWVLNRIALGLFAREGMQERIQS